MSNSAALSFEEESQSDEGLDELDLEGISLLSEIFPDLTREQLEALHFRRIESANSLNNMGRTTSHSDSIEKNEYQYENETYDANNKYVEDHINTNHNVQGYEEMNHIDCEHSQKNSSSKASMCNSLESYPIHSSVDAANSNDISFSINQEEEINNGFNEIAVIGNGSYSVYNQAKSSSTRTTEDSVTDCDKSHQNVDTEKETHGNIENSTLNEAMAETKKQNFSVHNASIQNSTILTNEGNNRLKVNPEILSSKDGKTDSQCQDVHTDECSTTDSDDSNIVNEINYAPSSNDHQQESLHIPLKSPLGRRILQNQTSRNTKNKNYDKVKLCIPEDFLRIPSHQAFHMKNIETGEILWNIVSDLENKVVNEHHAGDRTFAREIALSHVRIKTAILSRDMYVGLGLQIAEWKGYIYINALVCHDGRRIMTEDNYKAVLLDIEQSRCDRNSLGPAFDAGLKPGDRILGVNGKAFLQWGIMTQNSPSGSNSGKILSSAELLSEMVKVLAEASDPLALHILRMDKTQHNPKMTHSLQSFDHAQTYDARIVEPSEISKSDDSWQEESSTNTPRVSLPKLVHPFAMCLSNRGIIKPTLEMKVSEEIARYTNKALLWEHNEYLKETLVLRGNLDVQNKRSLFSYPGARGGIHSPTSLLGHKLTNLVRQALCIHIVNTFVDRDRLAYTIWVYDVETRTEWYAPVRYFQDFCDLRLAVSRLNKSIEKIQFPNSRWFHETEVSAPLSARVTRCIELEGFLRGLCTILYKEDLEYSSILEVSLYIQTFLGCDSHIKIHPEYYNRYTDVGYGLQEKTTLSLQRAVQLYTFRLFLLPSMNSLVVHFIADVKKNVLSFERDRTVSKNSGSIEKERILALLSRIKLVFSSLSKLIHYGCTNDFDVITASEYFVPDSPNKPGKSNLLQEAVKEQIEIHVYVPLRSVVSKLLVHGWRYDDKEIYYKRQALQKKNQSFFKIKRSQQSPSNWRTVIDILGRGVGQSTLPSVKLRSVVDAGKEIYRLSKEENLDEDSFSADDFLPIFIYCVVQADIEKPCALSVLLQNMCDEFQLIGEIGYYLSSFEAAIAYIHDLDLSSVN